jgi:hypothetical protein
MTKRKLRYSERKRLAETGSLGSLSDEPPDGLMNALTNLRRTGEQGAVGGRFGAALSNTCIEHFGLVPIQMTEIDGTLRMMPVDEFLDYVEILIETGAAKRQIPRVAVGRSASAIPNAGDRVNQLFERHRFGYRIEDGEIRKVGSPALDEEVVGPALLAVQRPGWDEAERSFKEALQHQRGPESENDDALTAANAALEAALKAAGFRGTHLGPLAKDFKSSHTVPPELKGVPEALDTLLKRSGVLRNTLGDSHGKAAGAPQVPQELVDLAINWAGAFIVYLSRAVPASP